jgi:hypothetical protein
MLIRIDKTLFVRLSSVVLPYTISLVYAHINL